MRAGSGLAKAGLGSARSLKKTNKAVPFTLDIAPKGTIMNSIEKLENKIKVIEDTVRLMDFFYNEYENDSRQGVFEVAKDILMMRAFEIECEIARMKDVQYDGR